MEKKETVGYLNFSTIQPIVDVTFWLKFTQLKLDVWKLDAPPVDITATISMPANAKVGSNLIIDETSLE